MARSEKKGRASRKGKRRNGALHAFVTNKWDGKESYDDFLTRESKLWNNLPSQFKNPFRKNI